MSNEKLNKKRDIQLGMDHGKARNILSRSIMFDFSKRLGLDVCFQCGKKIETLRELSIEHKTAWLDSDNPPKLYFDLNNIAFSHLSCNSAAGAKYSSAKLTMIEANEIREKLSNGETLRKLGDEYGVHHSSILNIKKNKSYVNPCPIV